jgi:hypothetical protein
VSQPELQPDLKEDKNITVPVVLPPVDIPEPVARHIDAQNSFSSPNIPVPPPLDFSAEDFVDSKESKDSKHESAPQNVGPRAASNAAAPRFASVLSFQEELVKRQQERQSRRDVVGAQAFQLVEQQQQQQQAQQADQTPRFGESDLAAHLRLALGRIRVVVGENKTEGSKRSQSSTSNSGAGPSASDSAKAGRKQDKDDEDDDGYEEVDWL